MKRYRFMKTHVLSSRLSAFLSFEAINFLDHDDYAAFQSASRFVYHRFLDWVEYCGEACYPSRVGLGLFDPWHPRRPGVLLSVPSSTRAQPRSTDLLNTTPGIDYATDGFSSEASNTPGIGYCTDAQSGECKQQ